MPLSPEVLTANAEVLDRLTWTFDLHFVTEVPLWFSVDGAKAIGRIARDGTGGVFALVPGSPRVLYVSSEGAAGIVAADLDEFIALIVACPYWRDILHYSGSGNLDEMRRAAAAQEAGAADDEELEEARALLKSELRLTEPADPVGALHRAVSTSDVIVRAHGIPFGSLFNHFTIDDNPMLRVSAD